MNRDRAKETGMNFLHNFRPPACPDCSWLPNEAWRSIYGLILSIGSIAGIINLSQAQTPLAIQLDFDASLKAEIAWTPHSEPSLYTVQSIDKLGDTWKPIPPIGQWPIEATQFVDPRASFLPTARFYRVLADPLPKPERGRLISSEKVDTLTLDEVIEWLDIIGISAFEAQSGVNLYYVLYETIDPNGQSTVASGGVVTPTDFDVPLPLFSYQHGTVLDREAVPSRFGFNTLESLLPIFIASQGFVTAAPDYLGLGDSPGFHPLLQSASAVSSVVDILAVAEDIAADEELSTVNELYLLGYGEGGHATMATHRDLEADEDSPYEVIASVPMAGPHDLSGLWLDQLLREDTDYPQPYLLPYLLIAYNNVYSFYEKPEEVFTVEVASRVIPRINGRTAGDAINAQLPSTTPREMLQPAFLEALLNDENHPFRVALRENDVFDWKPQASLRMYHCDADETVPKTISEKALDTFFANGSSSAELIDPIPVLNHEECDAISFTSAMIWIGNERN